MACSTNQKPSIYFEDDVQFHTQLCQTIKHMKQDRILGYELNAAEEAQTAIAKLIKAKAEKQLALLHAMDEKENG